MTGPRWSESEDALLDALQARHPTLSLTKLAETFCEQSNGPKRSQNTVTTRLCNIRAERTRQQRAQLAQSEDTTSNKKKKKSKWRKKKKKLTAPNAPLAQPSADAQPAADAKADHPRDNTQQQVDASAAPTAPARSSSRSIPAPPPASSAQTTKSTKRAKAHSDLIKEQEELIKMQKELVKMRKRSLDAADFEDE